MRSKIHKQSSLNKEILFIFSPYLRQSLIFLLNMIGFYTSVIDYQ